MLNDSLPLATIVPPILLSCIAVVALVISDFRDVRAGRYLFKPLAALAFVWLALSLDAQSTTYGQWLLAALVFCLLGDLLLMPDSERSFLAGLAAFLCGHLLFAVAFFQLPGNPLGMTVSTLPVLVLLIGVWRWLIPHVNREMKLPVILYILVISAMLLCAGLTAGQPAAYLIIIGAWGFACSDLAVARRQFILPASRMNGVWGTPLYFVSQMVLAYSVALA
ncbi:MAG: lysoplasmalogenase [Halioglobus sp.]|nr:lysoplasmalogenase [Halioglobus sp.]